MSRWSYYSPFIVGLLLPLTLYDHILESDRVIVLPEPARWAVLAGVCLACAIHAQLAMIACQGSFARVLPVPFGRSMRGREASLCGWFLLGYLTLACAALLVRGDEFTLIWRILLAAALACLLAAAIAYIWGWPAAVRDFDDRPARPT